MLGLAGTVGTPAVADPPSSAQFTIPVTCDGTTYTLGFIPGRGEFTPALVANGTQVVVSIAFDITFTDMTTRALEHVTGVQGAGSNPNAVTCTVKYTAPDPETGDVINIQGYSHCVGNSGALTRRNFRPTDQSRMNEILPCSGSP
jgi:hypothetical protein